MRPVLLAALLWALPAGAAAQASPVPGRLAAGGALESLGRADLSWEVAALDGRPVRLDAFRGRPLVVNLWATWCRPCVVELPTLAALRDSLRGTDVAFLAVSAEAPATVRAFVERWRVGVPVYLERTPLPASFGVVALPTTLVIDRAGHVVLRHRGAADWDREPVRRFLRALAAGATAGPPGGA